MADLDLGLRGQTALITGGSRGIGAATAGVMASEGASLILVARDETRLEQVRREIVATARVQVEIAACDLTRSDAVASLAERYQEIDILINNAGKVPVASLFEISEARWRAGWESKAFQYITMCRAFYPILKARGGGVIVNVSGIAARLKSADSVWSGMGNAALDFLTETLGAASPKDNIRVIGVSPGPVDTDRFRELEERDDAGSGKPRNLPIDVARLPFGRAATPSEIGAAIAFAASQQSAYLSGTVVVVDGGICVSKRG